MSHYTEGVLQAYLDGEVAGESRAAVAAHVAGCAACAGRLRELGDLADAFRNAIALTDVAPLPSAALNELRVRARATRSNWFAAAGLARAASMVLGLTLVAAAAVPGSPLNGWLRQVLAREDEPLPVAPAPPEAAPPQLGGIYFAPADGRIRIGLRSLAPNATVEVSLVDSDRALVEAADIKNFRTSPGRADVVGASGAVRIFIPRVARDAAIEVDGELYVTRVGDEFKLVNPKAERVFTR